MGAPSCIVVFGVRTRFGDDFEGMENLELRRHPWITRAQAARLEHWWASVELEGEERYVLFIGDIVGHIGPEHAAAIEVAPDELVSRCKAAGEKLRRAGFTDEFGQPALWAQWIPDF